MKTKLSEEKIYYVYKNVTKDTGEIFYIGKGKNRRAFEKNSRNKLWINIVHKHGYVTQFIQKELTEKEALDLEIIEIAKHNPRANLAKGGRGGATGLKRNLEEVSRRAETQRKQRSLPEWKEKNSAIQREVQNRPKVKAKVAAGQKRYLEKLKKQGLKHPSTGKIVSDKTKQLISDAQKGEKGYWYGKTTVIARPILNVTTGEVFPSLKKAAISVNGQYRGLLFRMKKGLPYKKNLFRYYNDV